MSKVQLLTAIFGGIISTYGFINAFGISPHLCIICLVMHSMNYTLLVLSYIKYKSTAEGTVPRTQTSKKQKRSWKYHTSHLSFVINVIVFTYLSQHFFKINLQWIEFSITELESASGTKAYSVVVLNNPSAYSATRSSYKLKYSGDSELMCTTAWQLLASFVTIRITSIMCGCSNISVYS